MRDNKTMGAGTKQPKPLPQSPVSGLAAAAQKFREWEARNRIIEELERLGIPRQDWPADVQRPAKPEFSESHQKSREGEPHNRIMENPEPLGIPRQDWPADVQRPAKPEFSESHQFECFQPPDLDMLRESWRDWVNKADDAWDRYRDRQERLFEFLVEKGVDEPIPHKRSRGPGT